MSDELDDQRYMHAINEFEAKEGSAGVALDYAYRKLNLLDQSWSAIDSKAWQAFRASLAIAAIAIGLPKSAGFDMPVFWGVAVLCLIATAVLAMVAMTPTKVTIPADINEVVTATNLDSEKLQLLIAASLFTTERQFKVEIESKAKTVYRANGATVLAIILMAVGALFELYK